MIRNTLLFLLLFLFQIEVFAYKVYSYDSNGERVYRTLDPAEYHRYKSIPRRAYVRQPRENWEITDEMRHVLKRPYKYKGKN